MSVYLWSLCHFIPHIWSQYQEECICEIYVGFWRSFSWTSALQCIIIHTCTCIYIIYSTLARGWVGLGELMVPMSNIMGKWDHRPKTKWGQKTKDKSRITGLKVLIWKLATWGIPTLLLSLHSVNGVKFNHHEVVFNMHLSWTKNTDKWKEYWKQMPRDPDHSRDLVQAWLNKPVFNPVFTLLFVVFNCEEKIFCSLLLISFNWNI